MEILFKKTPKTPSDTCTYHDTLKPTCTHYKLKYTLKSNPLSQFIIAQLHHNPVLFQGKI